MPACIDIGKLLGVSYLGECRFASAAAQDCISTQTHLLYNGHATENGILGRERSVSDRLGAYPTRTGTGPE